MNTNREKIVVKTSIISIISNVILSIFKAAVGVLSNSIAIITDAINNFSDALSSIITIIGTKLAGKAPDKKHPYGHGRIEHLTSLLVSGIVLYAGLTALIESIGKAISPVEPDYDSLTLVILIVGIIVKFILGLYVKKKGKDVNSDSLVASGADAFNDAILSISVLASAIIYIAFHVDIEAYIGILVSLFIIKAGIELIKESVDNILGTRIESELSQKIKQEVAKEKSVKGAFDLILHDFGPDKYLGSIHIEVPDTLTVSEVDKISRNITKNIKEKYGVILHTIGIYSINTRDEDVIKLQKSIKKIVFSHKDVIQMHGFFFDKSEKTISFDIVIDADSNNPEEIYSQIYDQVQSNYPSYHINITLDIDTSD